MASMKATLLQLSLLLFFCDCVTSFIVPEEVPTILSLIYSNIPPVKKGTDSRLGVGFRLGEHADFQVLLELGPQRETQPIGNVDTKRRRQATLSAAMRGEMGPWAQSVAKYQTQLRIQKELEEMRRLEAKLKKLKNEETQKELNSNGSHWLDKWSKGMVQAPEDQAPSDHLPIQDILPNRSLQRIALPASKEDFQMNGDVMDKMEGLKKLYKPQSTV